MHIYHVASGTLEHHLLRLARIAALYHPAD